MPGSLVPAVQPVHVPVPRRRLLSDGSRASGPPERGLFEYRYKMEQGNLLIKAGEMPTTGQSHREYNTGREDAMRLIERIGDWFDQRLQLAAPIRETPSIRSRARPQAGSMSSAAPRSPCFMLQIVTGILLALLYVPSAGEAWNSLQTLNHRSRSAGSFELCTAGARISWSRSS